MVKQIIVGLIVCGYEQEGGDQRRMIREELLLLSHELHNLLLCELASKAPAEGERRTPLLLMAPPEYVFSRDSTLWITFSLHRVSPIV